MDVSDQLHGPAALPHARKHPRYSLDRMLGGLQSRYGRGDEGKIPGIEPWSSSLQPLNYTDICQL